MRGKEKGEVSERNEARDTYKICDVAPQQLESEI